MTMRKVSMVRFLGNGPTPELWGRRVTSLRAQDGYQMRYWPESGTLLIRDAKEGNVEVCVHASRVDIYLEPEETPAPAPDGAEVRKLLEEKGVLPVTPAPATSEPQPARPQRSGAPQVK
jgi:hypothetical protein